MDNAKQHCFKVNIFTDGAPYIINLNVIGYGEATAQVSTEKKKDNANRNKND
jgi:hypothetical protein